MDLVPVSRYIEIGLAISGILILWIASRAFLSKDAWGEDAEYEMLGICPPPRHGREGVPGIGGDEQGSSRRKREKRAGTLGVEDRIIRMGFSMTLAYLAVTWFGWGSVATWTLVVPIMYLASTSWVGVDPVYRRLGLSTWMD